MFYVEIGMRCLIGAVFLISFLGKVSGPGKFAAFIKSVHGMRIVPSRAARPVARVVLAAEASVCLLLAVPAAAGALAGFTVSAALLVSFALAITLSVRRGVRAPCRCFGASAVPLRSWHAVRNLLLTACAAGGAVAATGNGQAHVGGAALAVFGGLLLGVLVTLLDDLFDLFRPGGDTGRSVRPPQAA
ncbi:MauE/DoxX family redox-associated membrane protein [Streptomyces sp. NPDC025273]|uniref:MauE/DoxX family redox-associated membrane protein n=1 Tax=unclassified Streptomyces TaxID=2593676 RepID=UPI0033C6991E